MSASGYRRLLEVSCWIKMQHRSALSINTYTYECLTNHTVSSYAEGGEKFSLRVVTRWHNFHHATATMRADFSSLYGACGGLHSTCITEYYNDVQYLHLMFNYSACSVRFLFTLTVCSTASSVKRQTTRSCFYFVMAVTKAATLTATTPRSPKYLRESGFALFVYQMYVNNQFGWPLGWYVYTWQMVQFGSF